MYDTIPVDLIEEATQFIHDNDRLLYQPLFEKLEEFCTTRVIMFGGKLAIDMMEKNPIDIGSYFAQLYCENAYEVAMELVKVLYNTKCPHINTNYLLLCTEIKHSEFTIRISSRPIIKIYNLAKYRGVNLVDLMNIPSAMGVFTGKKVLLLSINMQLLPIYRELYSPKSLPNWTSLLSTELSLQQKIHNHNETIVDQSNVAIKKDKLYQIYHQTYKGVNILQLLQSVCVLIGDYALIAMDLIATKRRMQFISTIDINEIVTIVNRSLKGSVTMVSYHPNVPNDFQLRKYTLFDKSNGKQEAICDIYNSGTYEMIPYIECNKIRIGNPWVLMRFMLIDIWMLQLVSGLGNHLHQMKPRINEIQQSIVKLHCIILTRLSTEPLLLFQIQNYAGVYIDENVAKKLAMRLNGQKYFVFYPARAAQITGSSQDFKIDYIIKIPKPRTLSQTNLQWNNACKNIYQKKGGLRPNLSIVDATTHYCNRATNNLFDKTTTSHFDYIAMLSNQLHKYNNSYQRQNGINIQRQNDNHNYIHSCTPDCKIIHPYLCKTGESLQDCVLQKDSCVVIVCYDVGSDDEAITAEFEYTMSCYQQTLLQHYNWPQIDSFMRANDWILYKKQILCIDSKKYIAQYIYPR